MPRRSRPLIGRNTAASRRYRNARAIETPLQSETRRALRHLRYSEARVAATQTMQVPVQRIQLWTHKPFSGLEYNAHIDYKADSSVDIGQMSRVCQFCSALRFRDEPFSLCCKQGRVSLPAIEFPPEPIFSLLSGLHPLSKRYRNARAIETPLQSATRRALRHLRYSEARVAATQTMQVPVQRIQLWTHKPFSGLEYNAHIDYKADSSVDIGQMSRIRPKKQDQERRGRCKQVSRCKNILLKKSDHVSPAQEIMTRGNPSRNRRPPARFHHPPSRFMTWM
ncbi:hypothetical protein LAZ67_14000728 [Cordylochernes scorpioides]|uniref:Uncharacterized protein n=1 Tax=Cordylochernes scorpioides TaxID=51811 RepID=A0ABY6L5Q4_9ARAC|nr:hypothetical protein LAZ67_14000728 [Cordylochernes scorpioides]